MITSPNPLIIHAYFLGVHYCIVYWWTDDTKSLKTVFSVNKILVDGTGRIQAPICSSEESFSNAWFQPFIYGNAIFFQPYNLNIRVMLKSNLKTFPFSAVNTEQPQIDTIQVSKYPINPYRTVFDIYLQISVVSLQFINQKIKISFLI